MRMNNRRRAAAKPLRKAAGRGRELRRGAAPAPVPAKAGMSIKDKVAIVAGLSQVFLVGVVILGYFYIVMPIYQKDVLDDRLASRRGMIAGLEEKNTFVESKIRENESILAAQGSLIARNQKEIDALQASVGKLSEEQLAVLRERKEAETDVARLRDDLEAGKKSLLAIDANIARNYRTVFAETMKEYTVSQFVSLYGNGRKARGRTNVDSLLDYKNKTIPAAVLIEKSLQRYEQKLSDAFALIPQAARKKLADEFRISLSAREELKVVPFSDEKVIAAINARDRRIFDLPDNLPAHERARQAARISGDYNRTIITLLGEFRRDYIKQVRDFFTE